MTERFYDEDRRFRYDLQLNPEQGFKIEQLSESFNCSASKLLRVFVKWGAVLSNMDDKQIQVMFRQDREFNLFDKPKTITLASLDSDLITDEAQGDFNSDITGLLQEMANKYRVTVEELLAQHIKKGIVLAEALLDPNTQVYLKEKDGESQFDWMHPIREDEDYEDE